MTLTPNQRAAYRELKDYGVEISKHNHTEHNSGSETVVHAVAKHLVGVVGVRNGYRVSSEVTVKGGSIDVVLWGHPDRMSYAVEVETGLTPDVKASKMERYVHETPIDDIQFIECNDVPIDMVEAYGYIATQLGLEP